MVTIQIALDLFVFKEKVCNLHMQISTFDTEIGQIKHELSSDL